MANNETSSGKLPVVENPVFKLVLQALVPVLLGVLVTLAMSINSAQKDQGDKLGLMQGQLAVIVQQSTDFGGRLSKVEAGIDDSRRSIGNLDGRVLVLENLRHK